MLIRLLSLLLIASAMLPFGSAWHAAVALSAADPAVATVTTTIVAPAHGCDDLLELAAPIPGTRDDSGQSPAGEYSNCLPDAELHGSVSEKFDSAFCESMVLHLVAQTTGKLRPRARIAHQPYAQSLVHLSVLLQV